MNAYLSVVVILLPLIGGVLIPLIPFSNRNRRNTYIEAVVICNAILTMVLLCDPPDRSFNVIHFMGDLMITFKVDGMSTVFAAMISFLWPFASLYAFEYMKKEENEKYFFMFYTMTYGVTMGIALSGNLLTMYCFYELLTLVTVPLVLHTLTREAVLAARKYLYFSLGGAAFAFMGLVFIIVYGTSMDFVYGGVLDPAAVGENANVLYMIYVMAFMGFGVKAAIFPFHSWLPQAGVAPTPVTALLHAVAVVKSGAFAIIRITYYSFGVDFLRGSWAQDVVMAITIVTIVFGCSKAVKEDHLKRRLAYSTVSNLSYILFGVTIMTPMGLLGAISHMVFHAFMKITAFFCAGSIMYVTDKHYVHELNGLGKRMPVVFSVMLISFLSLMGVPGLAGFISKWNLATAAADSRNPLAYAGIAALLISALLTAIYGMSIIIRAFFKDTDFDRETVVKYHDPNWQMLLPLIVFTVIIVLFGLKSDIFIRFFSEVVGI